MEADTSHVERVAAGIPASRRDDSVVSRSARARVAGPLVRALRPRQWIKNVFVLAPLLFGQRFLDGGDVGIAILAMACFCLASSSIYLVNDVRDREQDLLHPVKRRRPIASGALSSRIALGASAVLAVGSAATATALDPYFGLVVVGYIALSVAYSSGLKHIVVLDVLIIAAGFVLRVVGGAVALRIEPSVWIIVCMGLLALMLGYGKRRGEVLLLDEDATAHRRVLSKYTQVSCNAMMLTSAGLAIATYIAYSATGNAADNHLELTVPFVLCGVLRYLWLVFRERLGDSPTEIVWTDRPIILIVLGWAVTAGLLLAA